MWKRSVLFYNSRKTKTFEFFQNTFHNLHPYGEEDGEWIFNENNISMINLIVFSKNKKLFIIYLCFRNINGKDLFKETFI